MYFLVDDFLLLFFHSLSRDTRRNKIILPKYNGAGKYISFITAVEVWDKQLKKMLE